MPAGSLFQEKDRTPKPETTKAAIDRAATRRRKKLRTRRRDAALRGERVFARLVDGCSYVAIAREENCTVRRVREIVADALNAREADPPAAYARLQVARPNQALEVASAFMLSGDLAGMDRYVKIVEQLDRYHGATKTAAPGEGAPALSRLTQAAIAAPRALPAPEPISAPDASGPDAEPNRLAKP